MRSSSPRWPSVPVVALIALSLGGQLSGCRTERNSEVEVSTTASSPGPAISAAVRGLDASVGHVESVRESLRLVVLDYSLTSMPPMGSILEVFREGRDVGHVKVTGPARQGSGKIGGEIVDGEIQTGDVVRLPGVKSR